MHLYLVRIKMETNIVKKKEQIHGVIKINAQTRRYRLFILRKLISSFLYYKI